MASTCQGSRADTAVTSTLLSLSAWLWHTTHPHTSCFVLCCACPQAVTQGVGVWVQRKWHTEFHKMLQKNYPCLYFYFFSGSSQCCDRRCSRSVTSSWRGSDPGWLWQCSETPAEWNPSCRLHCIHCHWWSSSVWWKCSSHFHQSLSKLGGWDRRMRRTIRLKAKPEICETVTCTEKYRIWTPISCSKTVFKMRTGCSFTGCNSPPHPSGKEVCMHPSTNFNDNPLGRFCLI